MPTTSKSSKKTTPAAAARKPEFADAFTPLYVNGVERLAELQKKSLDIAAEQSAEWMNAWKKAFSYFPATPRRLCLTSPKRPSRPSSRRRSPPSTSWSSRARPLPASTKTRAEAYADIAEQRDRHIPEVG